MPQADLLVRDSELLVTLAGEPVPGGWLAVSDGRVVASGRPGSEPTASEVLSARGCLVTPGLINTHHHIYQNLTRPTPRRINGGLFAWLTTLYPLWARLDEEAAYLSAWVGLAELALGGCTTTTDHLYVAPAAAATHRRRDRGRPRARAAVPPDPWLDEPVGQRTAGSRRTRRAGRRRDPRRQRAPGRRLHHDPSPGSMVPGGAGAVLAVLGDAAR